MVPAAAFLGLAKGSSLAPLALAVQGLEAAARQVDLAARLQLGRGLPLQHQRHRADGAHVGGHVVAPQAVAARHAAHQPAALVVQRHREAVDLELGHVGDLARPHQPEDALLELAQLVGRVGVVEAEHGHAVAEARELLGGALAHALGRAVGGHQVGEGRLDLAQLALERVVLLVGDLGSVEDVVEPLVAADLVAQGSQALFRLAAVHGWPPGRTSPRDCASARSASTSASAAAARAGAPGSCARRASAGCSSPHSARRGGRLRGQQLAAGPQRQPHRLAGGRQRRRPLGRAGGPAADLPGALERAHVGGLGGVVAGPLEGRTGVEPARPEKRRGGQEEERQGPRRGGAASLARPAAPLRSACTAAAKARAPEGPSGRGPG